MTVCVCVMQCQQFARNLLMTQVHLLAQTMLLSKTSSVHKVVYVIIPKNVKKNEYLEVSFWLYFLRSTRYCAQCSFKQIGEISTYLLVYFGP